jgi:hypothetical protein
MARWPVHEADKYNWDAHVLMSVDNSDVSYLVHVIRTHRKGGRTKRFDGAVGYFKLNLAKHAAERLCQFVRTNP